ncbi:aldo/keto reductase [Xenorhabdus sp. Flor]|uniref:aldo/keto reductase n=1 Tax=Xenorhabdus cabanillasii TaxID=351673 RepID=UPI0019CB6A24|nr:aldo/keto reductase [Xenorhabdus sp. Flor]MBD2816067.1 aldo/keto reductase [Xenorhabdus sp. Flor]
MYSVKPSEISNIYIANKDRYRGQRYENIGPSGLKSSKFALGMWQGFSAYEKPYESERIIRELFDIGINHFDLGNNYGRPPGTAESFMGELLRTEFGKYRNEMIISTKAGYDMWPGPLGTGSSKKYLLSSLDESLKRLNSDYVDIFYSHRFDNTTPLWETAEALSRILDSGKALYVGVSSYNREKFNEISQLISIYGKRIIVNQCNFSMLCNCLKNEFSSNNDLGKIIGAFSPLSQGLLTERFRKNKLYRPSMTNAYRRQQVTQSVEELGNLSDKLGMKLEELAYNYIFSHSFVSFVTIGISSYHHVDFFRDYKFKMLDERIIFEIERISKDTKVDIWGHGI